jgi:hypothetical protein
MVFSGVCFNPDERDNIITVVTASSHDDIIDITSKQHQDALLAVYIYGEPPAAKYLAQFILANVSFVNHIAPALLSMYPEMSSSTPNADMCSQSAQLHQKIITVIPTNDTLVT